MNRYHCGFKDTKLINNRLGGLKLMQPIEKVGKRQQ